MPSQFLIELHSVANLFLKCLDGECPFRALRPTAHVLMMSAAGADDEQPFSMWIGNLPHGTPVASLVRLCDEYKLGMPIYPRCFHGGDASYSSAILKFCKTEQAVDFLNVMNGRECWDRYPPMIVKFARQHTHAIDPSMMSSTAPTTPRA